MKRSSIKIISVLCAIACAYGATGCEKAPAESKTAEVINGGFETADLSGWTIEYGDAFTDDCVTSQKTFSYENDEKNSQISVNATGNWYLCGKGFDRSYSNARTGAIRSNTFVIAGDGVLSMKLAGGATVHGKGSAAAKDPETVCFVGVYRASDDRMIARQVNEYFLEHTESYVPVSKYSVGVYNTDNFYKYELDLSDYMGEEVYLRIVDPDESVYYGYLSVDDIRVGSEGSGQSTGAFFTKTKEYVTDATADSEYEIANGDFETGSLAGWTIVSGDAFSNEGVNAESTWWNENITYSRDGDYHYGHYRPSATGVMRSSAFTVGGSGYISYKLGGCSDNGKTYLRFILLTDSGEKEVARLSNYKYWNFQFPYVANGMRLLNMVQYYVDMSTYLGERMCIEVVDQNSSTDDLGCITLDSVQTYWEEKPVWYTSESYCATYDGDVEIENEYQVLNGTFETGDLTGWTASGGAESQIGVVSSDRGWWMENFAYNKKGTYLFTGINCENNTGTLTSSAFIVGGCGQMTFLLGGGGDPALCYVSVLDAETGEELARYANSMFHDLGTGLINRGSNLANMTLYRADLTAFKGRSVKLQLVDKATNKWGLLCADSFITYYADEKAIDGTAVEARNILPKETLGEGNEYQVLNGDFETGDLSGWTLTSTNDAGNILGVGHQEVWWSEWFSFNKDGEYFLSGWNGAEDATGSLTSSAFTLGGSGWISFKLGGGKNTELCRVEIVDATTGEILAVYGNTLFNDNKGAYYYKGAPIDLEADGIYMANMEQYVADLSEYVGRSVRIRLVDEAVNDWGLLFADSFITYYGNADSLPDNATIAENLKNG